MGAAWRQPVRRAPSPVRAREAIALMRAALADDVPAISPEDALALREQLLQEDDARRYGQACLHLVLPG